MEINLSPAEVDITGVRAGDRNLFQLIIKAGGKVLDLTGYTITASARTKADDPLHLDAECTITDALAGKVDVRWHGDDVKTWLGSQIEQSGVWDLQLENGSDEPWTIITGNFQAVLDVTHG